MTERIGGEVRRCRLDDVLAEVVGAGELHAVQRHPSRADAIAA